MPAHAVASKKIKNLKKLSILTWMPAHAVASKKIKNLKSYLFYL